MIQTRPNSDFNKCKEIVNGHWRAFPGQNNNWIIGARPLLACFSPSAFSYCNSGCYGVFKSGIIHDSDFDRCKKIIKEFQRAISRDKWIKKAHMFPLSLRFQTRDRRKLTYSKELIIGARPPLACFSPSNFSYCNSVCYGVFKSVTKYSWFRLGLIQISINARRL